MNGLFPESLGAGPPRSSVGVWWLCLLGRWQICLGFVWTTTIHGKLSLKAQVGFEPLSICPCWGGAEQARCFLHCAVHVWRCWQELKWASGSRRCWAPASKAKSELQRNGLLHAIEVASFFLVDVTSFDKWLFHETELLSEVVQWALVLKLLDGNAVSVL